MVDFEVCSVSVSTRGRLPAESSCGPAGSVHRLGNVHAVDVVLEMVVEESNRFGTTKLKLKQVPQFLINAFNFINSHGMGVEGLFRREGNASRLNQNNWAVYLGAAPIPASFSVHDVCSMVKRFFRDLKEPLLCCGMFRKALMELAKKSETASVTRQEFCAIFEPGFGAVKKDLDYSIPPAHIGTLGYLMRQLHRISRHSEKHQMHAVNLATVFAPTLFRDEVAKEKAKRKERRGSQDDLLTSLREDTELRIAAVRLLIERANWIGLHPNCYLTSIHPHRSSSAAPSSRPPFILNVTNQREKEILDRKSSVGGGQIGRTKTSNGRRSSSAFRGIFHGIGGRLLRRSPSRDREQGNTLYPKSERRSSSPAIFDSKEPLCRQINRPSRMASPRYMLELPHSPVQVQSSEHAQVHNSRFNNSVRTSSTRPSRSRQPHCSATVKQILPSTQGVSTTTSSQSTGRCSRQNCGTSVPRQDPGKKRCESPPLRSNKVLKDNPVSMLGEEFFDPSFREQHERSRRRHTTPVKTSTALRRNQPNTRHSGLAVPKRRITVLNANDQEKENCGYDQSVSTSVNSSCDDFDRTMLDDEKGALVDTSADLLTQRGEESRLRRAKRQQRREISSLPQDSLFDSSSLQDTALISDNLKESRVMVSVACSPIKFPEQEDTVHQCHGSVVVGDTVVVSMDSVEIAQASLLKHRNQTETILIPQPSHSAHRVCEPLSTSSSTAAKGVSKVENSRRSNVSSKHKEDGAKNSDVDGSSKESGKVVFRAPSLPLPIHSSVNLISNLHHSSDQTRVNFRKNLTSPPSVSSVLPRTIPMPALLAEDSGDVSRSYLMLAAENSLEGCSTAVGEDTFVASDEMKEAILRATCDQDMEDSFGRNFRFRPSVAFIQKQGIVRDRVNMFRQLGNSASIPLEPISGRSSGLSSRSSLEAGSFLGDDECVKPSAPPVTHSLSMGGPRRNSSTSTSHQQFSLLHLSK